MNLAAAISRPLWQLVLVAALVGLVSTWMAGSSVLDSKVLRTLRFILILVLAFVGAWAVDHFAARDIANERRAINARAFDLRLRTLLPGSPLGCLDASSGEAVEDACEKTLFASPEATASAVSYVAAELALLSSGREHAQAAGISYSKILTNVRRAVEADRFGIVAHVLSMTGCTPDSCDAFALLEDRTRVSTNLTERPFEVLVKEHMATWPAAGAAPPTNVSASATPAAPAAVPPRPPSKAYFPSASSIPSVTIMAAEPSSTTPNRDATASADAATPGRKPPAAPPPPRQFGPANNGAATSGPLQIVPQSQ